MKTVSARTEVLVLVLAVMLGMSPWFSATVVAAPMTLEWGLTVNQSLWLTLCVQLGFVTGSLVSAVLLLSDRLSPRRLAAWSALLAAIGTMLLVIPGIRGPMAIFTRGVVGACLAGVYPPGIKLAAGWTTARRGLAIGALVAGTTLGSAVPHLLRLVVPDSEWRALQVLAGACALTASLLFFIRVREGPFQAPAAPFEPRALRHVLANRGVLLATGGYLGHMWELYAMWSSIGLFWSAVGRSRDLATGLTSILAFSTVGAGALGCLWAGVAADKRGRSFVTIVALAVSGGCSLAIGPSLSGSLWLVTGIAVLWGVSIVADSAQFSAVVTEYAGRDYVGTAVTVQTALGFLLTMVTIRLVPSWSEAWGWRYAYMPLAAGPVVGMACMSRLWWLEGGGRRTRPLVGARKGTPQ